MNETLISAIFSKSGIILIQELSTNPHKSISMEQLAENTGISIATTYRIMGALSTWSNIVSIKTPSIHAPLTLYYIKSHNFTILINKKGVQVSCFND